MTPRLIPDALQDIIMKCLENSKDAPRAHAGEIAKVLEAAGLMDSA